MNRLILKSDEAAAVAALRDVSVNGVDWVYTMEKKI